MGRKKINRTKEELDEMNRIRRMRSYDKNKGLERKKSLKRYYDKKRDISVSGGEEEYKSELLNEYES